jgi:hypothetical protein
VGGPGLEAHSTYAGIYSLVAILAWAVWPYARAHRCQWLLGSTLLFNLAIIGLSLLRVSWLALLIGALVVVVAARDVPIRRILTLACVCAMAWAVSPDTWKHRVFVTFHPWQEAEGGARGYSASVKARTIGWYVNRHLSLEGSTAALDQGLWGAGGTWLHLKARSRTPSSS